jgi:uncharacterized protein (DUF2062 family)
MSTLLARAAARIARPAIAQLKQGADPKGLALTCALGVALGAFPLMGTTTILCAIVGSFYRLNQPLLQSINYLMAPVQLALIPVFGYLGAQLGDRIGAPISVDLHPSVIMSEFARSPSGFLKMYGELGALAVLVWAVITPLFALLVYRSALSSFERMQKRRTA